MVIPSKKRRLRILSCSITVFSFLIILSSFFLFYLSGCSGHSILTGKNSFFKSKMQNINCSLSAVFCGNIKESSICKNDAADSSGSKLAAEGKKSIVFLAGKNNLSNDLLQASKKALIKSICEKLSDNKSKSAGIIKETTTGSNLNNVDETGENNHTAFTEKGLNDTKENNTDQQQDNMPQESSSFESILLYMINHARINNGIHSLNSNNALCSIAAQRSADMINRNYFSHNTPDGKNIFIILQEKGIMYSAAGENMYFASPPSSAAADAAFSSWMNSGPHRENILNPNFYQAGIGVSSNGEKFIAVIIFTN